MPSLGVSCPLLITCSTGDPGIANPSLQYRVVPYRVLVMHVDVGSDVVNNSPSTWLVSGS